MTYRQLMKQIIENVTDLDGIAKIRIISRDNDNCAIGNKDVPVVRVGGVMETVLCVEQRDIQDTDWGSP